MYVTMGLYCHLVANPVRIWMSAQKIHLSVFMEDALIQKVFKDMFMYLMHVAPYLRVYSVKYIIVVIITTEFFVIYH